ncbi:hypothetical protein PT2222_420052 [Paraburkholderia tropica]
MMIAGHSYWSSPNRECPTYAHPNQITEWKRQVPERAADVFGATGPPSSEPPVDVKSLHAKMDSCH